MKSFKAFENSFFEDVNPLYIDKEAERLKQFDKDYKKFEIEDISNLISNEVIKYKGNPCNNNYKIKDRKINLMMIEILNFLIENSDKGYTSTGVLYKIDYSEDVTGDCYTHDLVKKALGYLKCFLIIIHNSENNKGFYKANLNHWFQYQRYAIWNKELLTKLSKLIVEYCKSSKAATLPSFFDIIDDTLDYLSQPYMNHNINYYLENELLKNLDLEIKIRVLSETKTNRPIELDGEKIYTDIIEIVPKRILIKENKKYLECEDEDLVLIEIPIENIIRILIEEDDIDIKKVTKNYSNIPNTFKDKNNYYVASSHYINSFFNSIEIPKYFDFEYELVILELEYTALEYYRTKPLKLIKIFATDEEKITFEKEYVSKIEDQNFKIKKTKFYVVCRDDRINVINNILHVIDAVKIIEPKKLIGDVDEKINNFKRNNPW